MEQLDPQRYVLPGLLAVLILGAFFIIVTNGGGEPAGSVNRPATTTPARQTTTAAKPAAAPAAATPGSRPRFVKVQQGDTPTAIAQEAGITVQRLLELNPGVDPGTLELGQTLKLAP